MEKSCFFNKDSDTHIYHFSKEKLIETQNNINVTNNKKINYEKMDENDFEKQIDNIINRCKNNNILIIINSIDFPNLYTKINIFLEKMKTKSYVLQNITIINYTQNNKLVLYHVINKKKEEMFKKIINVFPLEENLFSNDDSFFANSKININIPKTIDPDKNILYVFKQKGGNIKNIIIRIMRTTNLSTKLKDQWWFLWYFSIPSCANIRLLQSTGTCWINSAINSLFLSEKILDIIKMRYTNKDEYKIKFKDFEKHKDTKKLCNALVYNLAINKTKAKYDDGNFLAHFASFIKCEYMDEPKKCKKKNYGDGGYAFEAIQILLNNIIEKNDFTCIRLFAIIGKYDEYDEIYKKYVETTEKFNENIDNYNDEIKKQNNDEYKAKYYTTLIKENEKKINELEEKIKTIQELWKNVDDECKKYDIDNNSELKNFDANKILVFSGSFDKNIRQNIIFNGKQYKLCASIIQAKFSGGETHVVSGIVCNDKYYVYDSNNVFLKCDWYKGGEEIQYSFESQQMKNLYSKILFDKIYVLIYIL